MNYILCKCQLTSNLFSNPLWYASDMANIKQRKIKIFILIAVDDIND